jgi:hypothetical protein
MCDFISLEWYSKKVESHKKTVTTVSLQTVGTVSTEMREQGLVGVGHAVMTQEVIKSTVVNELFERLDSWLNNLTNSCITGSQDDDGLVDGGSDDDAALDPDPDLVSTATKAPFSLPVLPVGSALNTKLHILDAWFNWWHGEECQTVDGIFYRMPPWRYLKAPQLKAGNTTRKYLQNLQFLCRRFDTAAGFAGKIAAPTIGTLTDLFIKRIKDVLPEKKSRQVEQLTWETCARYIRELERELKKKDLDPTSTATLKAPKKGHRRPSHRGILPREARWYAIHTMQRGNTMLSIFLNAPSRETRGTGPPSRTLVVCGRSIWMSNADNPTNRKKLKQKKSIIHEEELQNVEVQGCMIGDSSIDAYTNCLMEYCFADRAMSNEIYRIELSFFKSLILLSKTHGGDAKRAWANLPPFLTESVRDWDSFDVILIPIFVGPESCGHWSMLVCDRRIHKPGIFTWFDSLPSCSSSFISWEHIKELIMQTDIAKTGAKWIQAKCPEQGGKTMDCGPWSCINGASYIMNLKKAECN